MFSPFPVYIINPSKIPKWLVILTNIFIGIVLYTIIIIGIKWCFKVLELSCGLFFVDFIIQICLAIFIYFIISIPIIVLACVIAEYHTNPKYTHKMKGEK